MKILVIGARGQLGHELMCLSSLSEHEFRFADLEEDTCGIESLDITDRSQVDRFVSPDTDVIINCAAYNEVDKAEDDDKSAIKVNVEAVAILAEAALKADALLIHFSTDYVFDGKSNVPYTEEDQTSPLSAYGRSKLAGEKAVIQSGCRYMIFRTSWLYSSTGRNFFKTIAGKCAECPSLMVVNDQAGTPTYAYDLASLLIYIIDNDMLDKTGLYHYSNEGVATWYDFAKEINDSLGYTCRVLPCRTSEFPRKACRPSYSVLDKKKVKETFGIEVPHWRESLKMMVLDYENNLL
jgi:dTDP-4-dehydrorhamnose reductase